MAIVVSSGNRSHHNSWRSNMRGQFNTPLLLVMLILSCTTLLLHTNSVVASRSFLDLASDIHLDELSSIHSSSLLELSDAEEEMESMDQLIAQSEREMFQEETLQQDSESESESELDPSASLAELYESSHSSSSSHSHSHLAQNAPIQPAAPSPNDATLHFKPTLPAAMKFKRMVLEAQERLKHSSDSDAETESSSSEAGHKELKHKHHRSLVTLQAKVKAAAKARTQSTVAAKAREGAPDGGEGDWTTAPSWWKDPGQENVRPWKEDNYGYIMRHHDDPNSNMSPNPYPNLAAGRFAAPANRFALHRVLNTPTIAGVPASVHAYQYPGAPPLPELDATMQPTNNYPNAPFYEHDYNKDYIWG